ncbi:MAG: T9SS type A sorting domain-containing protein [Lewinella sp.]|nr:T9SS type A sorting domain-containing protein [Lewinella sp.]
MDGTEALGPLRRVARPGIRPPLRAWPNPSQGQVFLEHYEPSLPLSLHDQLGRAIPLLKPLTPNGQGQYALNLIGLTPGLYFLRCQGQVLRVLLQ